MRVSARGPMACGSRRVGQESRILWFAAIRDLEDAMPEGLPSQQAVEQGGIEEDPERLAFLSSGKWTEG